MSDFLAAFEKCAKGVRGGLLTAADVVTNGIVAASDNLAFLLDGLCRAPDSVAVSPPAADAAPVPKPGDSSGPADSDIPPSPAGPHPDRSTECLLHAAADVIEAWQPLVYGRNYKEPLWVSQLVTEIRDRATPK